MPRRRAITPRPVGECRSATVPRPRARALRRCAMPGRRIDRDPDLQLPVDARRRWSGANGHVERALGIMPLTLPRAVIRLCSPGHDVGDLDVDRIVAENMPLPMRALAKNRVSSTRSIGYGEHGPNSVGSTRKGQTSPRVAMNSAVPRKRTLRAYCPLAVTSDVTNGSIREAGSLARKPMGPLNKRCPGIRSRSSRHCRWRGCAIRTQRRAPYLRHSGERSRWPKRRH